VLYILLITTTLMQSGKSILFKKIGVSYQSTKQFFGLNGFSFGIAAAIAALIACFNLESLLKLSPFSVMMAALFALAVIGMSLTQMKALSLGATSSTMMIFSCGFLIPVIFGTVAYGEKLLWADIIALVLMVASLFLIINPDKNSKLSAKWLFFTFVAMTCSGTLAVLQKIHQHSLYADEFLGLSVLEFLFASVILSLLSLFAKKPDGYESPKKRELCFGLINGLFLSLPSMINLFLAGKFPAIIMFPIYNIGSIILSSVLGGVIYREKQTVKGIVGFIIGCIAILIIGVF